METQFSYKFLLGVDEAGRGPLAGPVAVGVVSVPKGFDIKKHFPTANDSKQLREAARESIYKEMEGRKAAGEIDFCVRFTAASTIDRVGITRAVTRGVWSGVRSLAPKPAYAFVKLDGLLHAPPNYEQETIVKGDALEPVISLASIVAKVRRDRLMKKLAEEYPHYLFEIHKGYGTAKHYTMLAKYGPSVIHRRSFLHLP
jgi:ribonuclease HII